ncbi:hypothetical protein Rhow_008965 [Rhodococcus wratislaviensis]|uniref:Uncharacterized protein n=1 Tax=Rhodococcus wratislaviensis TaxID=44752 RepID=A0A402CLV4_RHOWR|nr:hypothetical protein Rhow_008965 [Rhodococcus wratislaviensis]
MSLLCATDLRVLNIVSVSDSHELVGIPQPEALSRYRPFPDVFREGPRLGSSLGTRSVEQVGDIE